MQFTFQYSKIAMENTICIGDSPSETAILDFQVPVYSIQYTYYISYIYIYNVNTCTHTSGLYVVYVCMLS